MTDTLINFPARFAFTNPDGTLTMEALRLFRRLFDFIGAPNGPTAADVDLLGQFMAAPSLVQDVSQEIHLARMDYTAVIAEMQKQIDELKMQFAPVPQIKEMVYDTIF